MVPCGFWQAQALAKPQLWWQQWLIGLLVLIHFIQIKSWA
jgi:hypothetical protein